MDQVILTATDLSHFSADFTHQAALWKVSSGSIQTQADPG
jgi:recombinational DNA repair ATPase RecF